MQIKVKRLAQEEVYSLLKETSKEFTPPLSVVKELTSYSRKLSDNAYFAIAEEDDNKCGLIAFYLNERNNQIYIPYIFVYPAHRKQHVASQLLDYLQCSYKGNYKSIALEVVKSNKAALNLYKKSNFRITEVRTDTFLMQRILN